MKKLFTILLLLATITSAIAQETRLLRQPTISDTHIAYIYGSDLWISDLAGEQTLRLTSTGAVESDPHFSPDGKTIAFSSNRSGSTAVYTVPVEGGTPTRLTWYPSSAIVRGWTPDGEKVLYTSSRETAPAGYGRLWTVSKDGGPSTLLTKQFGNDGSYSADGKKIVIDRVSRWDVEWRDYRGGQNTPLIVLNLKDFSEELLPNNKETDIHPVWLGDKIYFLSDRDFVSNIWSYNTKTKALEQLTQFEGSDVKWLSGKGNTLTFERDGYLSLMDVNTREITQLNISITADFPWAETQWEDVSRSVSAAAISPTGK